MTSRDTVAPGLPSDSGRRASDPLGDVVLPAGALWGPQTERARLNFAIGREPMPIELVHALVLIKGCAARVNASLGRLDPALADAIEAAAAEVLGGAHDAQFPLVPWQSGSGTQTNMNVNEVLAALARARLSSSGRESDALHPNDHVNLGQSSNDMLPTAMHVSAAIAVQRRLLPALDTLAGALAAQAALHAELIKLGRTHLQDAVPLTLGQEIGAWRSQLLMARAAIEQSMPGVQALAAGATAVGTGLNTHPEFGERLCREIGERTGIQFVRATDPFAALAGHEALVQLHGGFRLLAVALNKIANDLRLLASGPRGGIGELKLPANEPGSSIMPGKVNPTQCEAVVMVSAQVLGNDLAVTLGGAGGQLQLSTMKPLIAVNVLASARLLADAMTSFESHAVRGLAPDRERIGALLHSSLMLATALAPHIGYDRTARIAQRAHADRITLRDAALALGIDAADFDRFVDPSRMLGPR